jgi:hypothetical protein
MPDTDDLETRTDAQWELVFVIEGISLAFVSHRHLESLSTGEGHTMRRGLEREGMRRRIEIDMRQGGIVPHTMRVNIHDHVGDLAELFSADRDDFEYLDATVEAGEDLAARTDLHDQNIGSELVGPAGERRQYPVPLGDSLGRQHYTGSFDAQLGATPSRVSSQPLLWAGRRCALYRVYRDHVTFPGDYSQGWRPASEWRRCWWGSMRDDGRVSGRMWTIECGGPETWLQKDLGQLTQRTPVGIAPEFTVTADENQAAVYIDRALLSVGLSPIGEQAFSAVFTGATVAELRQELADLVTAAADDAGTDGPWTDTNGNIFATIGGGRSIIARWSSDFTSSAQWIRFHIVMHRRMWERLGWNLGQEQYTAEFEHKFVDEIPTEVQAAVGSPPNDGYVALQIRLFAYDIPYYQINPQYLAGVAPIDPSQINAEGQVINMSPNTAGLVTHDGQQFAPIASDPADATVGYGLPDAGECNAQGLWLMQGDRRFAGQEDEFVESAIVQCSWRNQQGSIQANQVVATALWNPRRFGINRPTLSSTWSQQANAVEARPVLYLGYQQLNGYDLAHLVLQRILLTTGTSTGWSSFSEDLPVISDPGDNDPPILAGFVRLDTERADLGLAIPRAMVQAPGLWQAAAQTADDEALEVFVAIEPGTNSEDVFDGLLTPLGFAWSLAGGAYGIFTPHDPIEESDILWVLSREQQEGRFGGMVELDQDLRDYAPVDGFDVQWSAVIYGDDYRFAAKIDPGDDGRRYRPGGIIESIKAPFHRRTNAASSGIRTRQSERARFWARRHYTVRGFNVLPSLGRRIWPGEGARITHPLLVDAVANEYGVTARRARILAVEEDFSRQGSRFSIDFLAYAERTTTPRLHGPIAQGYGFDSDTDEILVLDDCLGLGNGWNDAAAFVEPTYVGLLPFGGNLDVHWWQNDGSGWSVTGSGTVSSVTTTPGSSRLAITGITGVYYPCADAIVMPTTIDVQSAAYAQALFVGIADEDGSDGTGPNQRFEDV